MPRRGGGEMKPPARLQLAVCTGPGALESCARSIDVVHEEVGVSAWARRPWLQAWASTSAGWQPWVLVVLRGSEARAVAPLARRRAPWGLEVVSMGDRDLNASPVVACDPAAAAALAKGLAGALDELRVPWMLRVRQLAPTSPVRWALADALGVSTSGADVPRPVLRVDGHPPGHRWLTRNTASALAKARNRVARDGRRLEIEWSDSPGVIDERIPELMAIHRARDHELRGASLLDDSREAGFYREVVARHRGRWRLLTVRIDGSIAGYAMCLQDREALRVWDNRVAPRWRRYSAGLIANAEVVLGAAADPSLELLDWGCGLQRYKASMSSEEVKTRWISAWSSSPLRIALAAHRRLASRRMERPGVRLPPLRRSRSRGSGRLPNAP